MNARRAAIALAFIGVQLAAAQQTSQAPAPVRLPNQAASFKFVSFGDFGNGTAAQYQTAAQLASTYDTFRFVLVATLGDNILGSKTAEDYRDKFEIPYKPLLDAGVKFYASLGNHDAVEERRYAPFNMSDRSYYSFKAPQQDVKFFMLETSSMTPSQVRWLDGELNASTEQWKIVCLHEPLYSSAATHGSNVKLRAALEPMFVKYGVTVVLSGHDHVYERIKPQHGIAYFVVGSGGELRRGDLRKIGLTAAGFDADNAFLAAEIIGDTLYFNAISRTGHVVDSGIITLHKRP